MLNTQIKLIKVERDTIINELNVFKNSQVTGSDPGEVNSLKRRLAKVEADLKDKSAQATQYANELDQLETAMEELKRRASVGGSLTADLRRPQSHKRPPSEGTGETQRTPE